MAFNPNDPEFKKAAQLASAFSNRAYVTIENGVTRIVFGESAANAGEVRYHTAITMTATDAIRLAEVIYATFDEAYPPQPPASPSNPFAGTNPGGIGGALRKPTGGG